MSDVGQEVYWGGGLLGQLGLGGFRKASWSRGCPSGFGEGGVS